MFPTALKPDPGENKEKKSESDKVNYSQWLKRGPNIYLPTDNSETVGTVEAGFYKIQTSQQGPYMFRQNPALDELTELPFDETAEVLDGIETFWARRDKFIEYGFAFKRGIILYGPPGTGKTSLINIVCRRLIERMNGVIFVVSNGSDISNYTSFMPQIFRTIEPTRPILTILEDIDGMCQLQSTETELINLLDGIDQLDNVVYIATTNYAEKLSDRILNRPNRFDRRVYVGYPNAKVREAYLRFKLKPHDLAAINLQEWIKETDGFTIAHIGELIKSTVILGNSFEKALTILQDFNKKLYSHEYNKKDHDPDAKVGSIGFAKR